MTIYQKELLRQLSNLGCAGYEDDQSGMLNITMDGLPLCIAGKRRPVLGQEKYRSAGTLKNGRRPVQSRRSCTRICFPL